MSLETGRDQQSSEYDRDLGLSAPAQDFQRDLAAMAAEIDVDARLIELQVAQHDLVQERRQARIDEADFARGRVEFESERRFEQRERRGARPGLRRRSEERRVGKECRSRWSPYH